MASSRKHVLARDLTHAHIGERFRYDFWCWEDHFEWEGVLAELKWPVPYTLSPLGEKMWHQDGPRVHISLKGERHQVLSLRPTDALEAM